MGPAVKPLAVLLPELLPTGGLGRPPPEERMPQHLLQESLVHVAFSRECSAAIVLALALRDQAHHPVNDHIAGPGVEGQNVRRRVCRAHLLLRRGLGGGKVCTAHPARRQERQIGNAADILHGPAQPLVLKEDGIGVGYQRRPFAARGHVARPKIRHGRDAGALGNPARLADLKRGTDRPSGISAACRVVVDRLPVRANEVDGA